VEEEREEERRSHRVSDEIHRARSGTLFPLFPRFPSHSCRSRAPLPLASVRTRSFTSPARRCMFFSDPFLRYSAALNGRLCLSRPRMDANPLLGDVLLLCPLSSPPLTLRTPKRRGYQVSISELLIKLRICGARLSLFIAITRFKRNEMRIKIYLFRIIISLSENYDI
jgi:hypothetical protein